MDTITFECSHCNQRIEAPPELFGKAVDCPSCKGRLRVPTVEATVGQNQALVTCPICHVKVKSSNLDRHVRNCQYYHQHNDKRIQEEKERKEQQLQYIIQAEKDRIRKQKEKEELKQQEEERSRKECQRHEERMRRYNALSNSEKEELRALEEECNFLRNRREPEFYGVGESEKAHDWLRERERQLGLDVDLPPRLPRCSGVAHRWLCGMCVADLPVTLLDRLFREEVGMFPLITGSLVMATVITAIVAIVKQYHSDLRTGLKSIPILVLTMIGLYAPLATGYFLYHLVKTPQSDPQQLAVGDPLYLKMTLLYTFCVSTLGIVGFVLLRVRGRQ